MRRLRGHEAKNKLTVKLLKSCAQRNYTNMTKEGKAGDRE